MQSDPAVLANLIGLACGGVIGLSVSIAMVVWLVRQRGEPTVSASGIACPRCGSTASTPATYTWWGGALGPRLLSHVQCASCKAGYNGKTGQPNTVGIVVYMVVSTGLVLAILGGLFVYFH